MPDTLEAVADALDTLPLAVRQAMVGIVQTLGAFLLDFNRDYLAAGQRPDGSPIDAGGYSPGYAAFRAKYGKQTAVKDLNFTGDYYKRFTLDYTGGLTFGIDNLDPKAAQLLKSYGDLYGVREADIESFVRELVEPEVQQVILQHMRP